ncbi:unnamed protein product [Mesocestoides corti]|uniref:Amidase domain-containing protein n=1 Tax=Mesocestoides corti TaxID=53468 RepID=A0A0R3UFM9_MESCO|nr:unnamed protein product [Mesocestoides corti]
MAGLKSLIKVTCKLLDAVSCLYIFVTLGFSAYVSSYIFKPIMSFQSHIGQFYLGYVICPVWICGRIGFKLLGLRDGPKRISKKKSQRRKVENNMSAKLCGLKTPLENVDKVTGLTLPQLRQDLVIKKDLTSIDTVEAMQVHILRLMQSTSNSVAEVIFDADVAAIMADQSLKRNGTPLSPLHGIPVCLSNWFSVKGEDCNASAVFRAGHSQGSDCALVEALRSVGTIPVALTNTSPLPGQPDASSRLYGTTQHPTHLDRVVGHSSTGVVVLQKGALLGFGLDAVGEVRLSAANVGLVGFKPTAQRLSTDGIVALVNFPEFLPPTVGVIGSHVSDIVDTMTALTSVKQDPFIPQVPFKPNASKESLTIGVYRNCPDILPVVPGVERVMTEVIAALKAQGHTVVEVDLPKPNEALLLALHSLISNDSYWNIHVGQHWGNSLKWNEIFKCWLPKSPYCLRVMLDLAIQFQQGAKCKSLRQLLDVLKKPFSAEAIRAHVEAYRLKFFELWDDEEIDLLVGPAAAAPALLKRSPAGLAFLQTGYSTIFNVVNCPAGVVPFGKTTQDDVKLASEVKAPSRSLYKQLLKQQRTAEGLPMAVQVIAKPWEDDLALRVMHDLEQLHHN